ncbi:hypothetical protein CBW16_03590 [Flavobacteriaceae bacterium JJC]|nr:hypothetical protein CBW16_03590 [Flavobacteriaceae bacterium JJC]
MHELKYVYLRVICNKSKIVQKIVLPELADWLESAIDYYTIKDNSLKISNFLPKFDYYVGIKWKVGIIEDFPFEDIIAKAESPNDLNSNRRIWRKFSQIYEDSDSGFTEIGSKELFEKFEIPFHEYKNDHRLPWNSRAIRVLDSKILESLSSLVNHLPEVSNLYLYWEDYYRYGLEDKLFKVSTEEFLNEIRETGYDASVYLFPESKNWCLMNLEDLGFNIFAFNENINIKIESLSSIEYFNLTYESEIYRY